jgi:hypothetical protein
MTIICYTIIPYTLTNLQSIAAVTILTQSSNVCSDYNYRTNWLKRFEVRFWISVLCEVLDDRVTANINFIVCLTWKVYLWLLQEELSRNLEDAPSSIRGRVYFQSHGASLHFEV